MVATPLQSIHGYRKLARRASVLLLALSQPLRDLAHLDLCEVCSEIYAYPRVALRQLPKFLTRVPIIFAAFVAEAQFPAFRADDDFTLGSPAARR